MAEKLSAWQSLKRSKKLIKGNMGRVLALIILLLAISTIAHWPITRLGGVIANTLSQMSLAGVPVVQNLLSMAGSILIAPITAVAMSLLYYDLRARKESLETQVDAKVEEVKPWWETWPKSWQ
jgi:phosphate/sulfate permease